MNLLKKIWNIVSTTLVAAIVLCAVLLMGSRLLGYQPLTVLSGSMQPQYSVGDLIFVKQVYRKDIAGIQDPVEREKAKQEKIRAVQAMVEEGTLSIGDPVTFVQDENLTICTHRIVKIDQENKRVYTKGDANEDEDAPVAYLNLIGPVHFAVPQLGRVSNYIQTPPGMYIAIAVGAVLIAVVFLPDLFGKKKGESDPEAAAVNEENEKLKAELERLKNQTAHYSSGELAQLGAQKDKEKSE